MKQRTKLIDHAAFIGIDPGVHGAIAYLNGKELVIYDMPINQVVRGGKNKNELDYYELALIIKNLPTFPKVAMIEKVGAMPGQGVTGMFQFGRSVGIVEGVLAANEMPIDYVAPRKWRQVLKVRKGKDGSRERASQLFPDCSDKWRLKKDIGRVEAALIALYAQKMDG